MDRLGVIAGNGRFPLLLVREACRRGGTVVVAAIREEAEPEWERAYRDHPQVQVHWLGLGQLGKLIELFHEHGVTRAVMAGQVKHNKIFAGSGSVVRRLLHARPDWRMMRLLMSLPRRNTASLIGGVMGVLEQEGIQLLDSTSLLSDSLPAAGVLTRRRPSSAEQADIDYGRPLARQLAGMDLGQTLVVKDQAVVAIEAMEGTDETIRRAARLVHHQPLTVVKVSRPGQDMRFDVPVLGTDSLRVFEECRVSALAIDAGRTLLLEKDELLAGADRLGIAIVAE